jgi:hypothetical protein
MVANGQVPSWLDNQELDDLLMEVGDDVLQAQQMKTKGEFVYEKYSFYWWGSLD